MAIRCGVTLMPASRHWATSRSMPVAWAAPVGGDEGRRAGGAERRERFTGEIFSTETVLSRPNRPESMPARCIMPPASLIRERSGSLENSGSLKLRPPRVADDLVGLALAAVRQRAADGGSVPIVPGGLDQDPPGVTVAGFGQRSAALRLARGVLARHEPEVGHEFARPAEALEVHHLGQEDDRRQRVDPAEASEPAHRLAIGRGGGNGLELLVEFRLPCQRLLEREHRGLERALERRQIEPLLADPPPVGLAPVLTGEVGAPVAGEELEHAMPPAHDVAAEIVATADEIAHGLLALVEDVDGGELAGAEQAHELHGIAAIGLDPLPRASRGQRRCNDRTGDAERRELPVEIVAGHSGFVARRHRPLALEPPEPATD